jgi:hypothetical protein
MPSRLARDRPAVATRCEWVGGEAFPSSRSTTTAAVVTFKVSCAGLVFNFYAVARRGRSRMSLRTRGVVTLLVLVAVGLFLQRDAGMNKQLGIKITDYLTKSFPL